MTLTESVKSAFETVFELEAQKKSIEQDINKAKAVIRKAMEEANETSIKQDGYYALIAGATRNTLQANEVEKLLGHAIPESCYKSTNYTTFTVKRMEMV